MTWMYCEECKKRPATVHLTSIVNGVKVESHLCEQCAGQKGTIILDLNQISIPNLLGSFFGNTYNVKGINESEPASCPGCGMTFNNICESGSLGCSQCYQVFEKEMDPILRRIHGNTQHVGKIPSRGGGKVLLKKQVDELKSSLQQALAREEYEKAAEIRDSIKSLEKQFE
jgi:protein arginine kinase activator